MSKPIVYAPSAIRDLEDIRDYISRDNPEAADRLAGELREAMGLLADFPLMGRTMIDQSFDGHRALVVGDYLVFYVVSKEEVQIRRVLHGARRYKPLLARE